MKAVRLLQYGGQLAFNDVPTPMVSRDEVLVKVRNTTVNHLEPPMESLRFHSPQTDAAVKKRCEDVIH